MPVVILGALPSHRYLMHPFYLVYAVTLKSFRANELCWKSLWVSLKMHGLFVEINVFGAFWGYFYSRRKVEIGRTALIYEAILWSAVTYSRSIMVTMTGLQFSLIWLWTFWWTMRKIWAFVWYKNPTKLERKFSKIGPGPCFTKS